MKPGARRRPGNIRFPQPAPKKRPERLSSGLRVAMPNSREQAGNTTILTQPAVKDMRRLAGPALGALLLVVCLLEAGCSLGITVSNSPGSIETCGRKIGGC
jgi:hypothetical protein